MAARRRGRGTTGHAATGLVGGVESSSARGDRRRFQQSPGVCEPRAHPTHRISSAHGAFRNGVCCTRGLGAGIHVAVSIIESQEGPVASRPRCFRAGEPVEIELRCAWRVRLIDDAAIAEELERLIAFEAARCQVRCLAVTIEVNHLHLVVAQEISGHDPARRVGIAAFMRNVESRATHFLNGHFSLIGRAWERSYRSYPRGDAAQLLKSLVYTIQNPVKHGAVLRAEDYEFNDADVYFQARPNGIVTHVPLLLAGLGTTPDERGRRIKELMDEVWAEGQRSGDLLDAARNAISRRQGAIDQRRWAETVPVGAWVGNEAAENKRKEILDRERPFVEFQPRRAPRVGDVIEINIRRASPRPLADASWRDWHA